MSVSITDPRPAALVVDDDGLIRMDAVGILEDAGFEVLDAPSADHALVLLEEHWAGLQLLFTDVHMPGTRDGFALARHVAECWPHITIVVASGQATPGPDDMPAGACFIAKPFSTDVVRDQLRRALPAHQQQSTLTA